MPFKMLPLLFLLAGLVIPVRAQDDAPTVADIAYDEVVEDTLTDTAFFDWWRFQAAQGDRLVIDMAASGGLEPLIGLLNQAGDLVSSSSEDGAPDATVSLEYTTPEAGLYTIVATRAGRDQGTSTGTYTLRLRLANAPTAPTTGNYQDVTFPCENFEVTTASTIRFGDDPVDGQMHRITVYGLEGFQPVIRVTIETQPDFNICNTDARFTVGDLFTLPGEESRAITADTVNTASQLILSGANEMGVITLTIGSKDGQPGRYVAILDGFMAEPRDDVDELEVRLGPLAAQTTSMTVYMVAAPNSRLDPYIWLPASEQGCDDAGRNACEDVPSFAGAGYTLHEGEGVTIKGDRQDSGVKLTPGSPDPVTLLLGSRSGDTHGGYVLVLIGELPPRE